MRLSGRKVLVVGIGTLKPIVSTLIVEFIIDLVSILATVIYKEIAKSKASFLTWSIIGI